jgi:hypothetical protein
MADIHDRAVIATAGTAIDQKVTATLRPHMAQSHRRQFPNFGRRHVSQFAPPSASRQHRRRASSWARLARGCQVTRCSRACAGAFVIVPLSREDVDTPSDSRTTLTATMRLSRNHTGKSQMHHVLVSSETSVAGSTPLRWPITIDRLENPNVENAQRTDR